MIREILIKIALAIPVVVGCYFYEASPKFRRFVRGSVKFILLTIIEALVSLVACSILVHTLENLRDMDGE